MKEKERAYGGPGNEEAHVQMKSAESGKKQSGDGPDDQVSRQTEEMFKVLFGQVSDSIFIMELMKGKELVIADVNSAVRKMYGYERGDLAGHSISMLDSPETAEGTGERTRSLRTGEQLVFEGEHVRKDGTVFPVEVSAQAVMFGKKTYIVAIVRDIDERKKLEEKLREDSITDDLTGLFNRRGFLSVAQKEFEISIRNKRNFSLLFLDLNDMKAINDALGHQKGDQALVDFAEILKGTFRASDIIGRIGGDEFVVFIPESRQSAVEKTVIRNIEEQLRLHNETEERPYLLSASIGTAHYDPERPCTLEELLCRADESMYKDKERRQMQRAGVPVPKLSKGEFRDAERTEVDSTLAAELFIPDKAMIKNISLGGVCMRSESRLTKNTVYKIRIRLDDGEDILPKGMVVWSLAGRNPAGDHLTPYYESGLRFIEVNERAKKTIRKVISELSA